MTSLYIEAQIAEPEALAFFRSKGRARKWFGGPSRSEDQPEPFTERVWMPFYIVPLNVTSRKGPGEITVSVEGYSGAFAIFQMHAAVRDGFPEGQSFPPRMDEPEAVDIARKEFFRTIMRQRSNGPKPQITSVGEVYLVAYPFWVQYFERRSGLLDIKILDAATGAKGGAKTKTALFQAFTDAASTEPSPANAEHIDMNAPLQFAANKSGEIPCDSP